MITLLLSLGGGITFVLGAVVVLMLIVGKALISEEIRTRLERIPVALLRLVAAKIPADQREDLYDREWLPELLCHLRKAEGMPITRLVIGIKYSVSLFRSAPAVARDLRELRDGEEATAANIPRDPLPAPVLPSDHMRARAGAAVAKGQAGGVVVLQGSGTPSFGGTSVTKSAGHGWLV